ncbi:MAG: pore-forming ESAT-6 family protein [Bulleidia sp.]|nr:pore-forming ESAT-6 family protein [Bulleidia sp.]
MADLNISLAEVSECAASIRTCNEQMYECLSKMKKEMDSTGNTWISDGAEAIRSRFAQFSNRFESQKETIDSYARFLDRTVESYDTLETTITSNASGMQS